MAAVNSFFKSGYKWFFFLLHVECMHEWMDECMKELKMNE